MRILVTNDDGIDQAGLVALVGELAGAGHEVRVLAPAGERSGSSSSLGTVVDGARLVTRSVSLAGWEDVVAHSVDAPPALAVRAVCLGALGWVPELVVAGINPGLNTGRLVLHSGTVGAAVTATSRDITGIAVSTAHDAPHALAGAAALAGWLVELVAESAPPPLALNLNVPAVPLEQISGVREAALSESSISDVTFEADAVGLRVRRRQNAPPFGPGTDAAHLSRGAASLSSVSTPWAPAPSITGLAADLHERWVRWSAPRVGPAGQEPAPCRAPGAPSSAGPDPSRAVE